MKRVHVVVEKRVLDALNDAARRSGKSRSAVIREALKDHLRSLEIRLMEERDRQGYERNPQTSDEWRIWEQVASWPQE